MKFTYESERLCLKILNESFAPMVLDFLYTNRNYFEPYEAEKSDKYYTLNYQKATLRLEFNSFLHNDYARFYVFRKDEPNKIIGTISFGNMLKQPFCSTSIGYKFDEAFCGYGYATEAITCAVLAMFRDADIHRIEALVLPDNVASIHLLERIGFEPEGVSKSAICIQGIYRDHKRYALINDMVSA